MDKIWFGCAALLLGLFGAINGAQATVITSTLGNSTPGFNDGDTPAVFVVGGAQGGQPAPFDTSYGSDILGVNFSASWTHNYAPIVDTIISASITIGIVDHDSSASGSQLASFTLETADLTTNLDLMFEAIGEGADAQYDIYSVTLPASVFVALMDGSAAGTLNLQGPGLVTPLFPLPGPNPPTETVSNGANLIYSTLAITTQTQPPTGIPETPTLLLALLGLGIMGWRQSRRISKAG